ncbi:MAG: hypothetical protein GXO47_00685 [Chlorobi bacterium]|nr:hypothetical protein [Chlorobiota bacterium]
MRPETVYQQIKILYMVIFAGLVMFGVAAYYFVTSKGNISLIDQSTQATVQTLLIILVFVGIPVSYMFHKKNTSHIDPELSLTDKLLRFRKSLFIKLITLEGLAMFSLIGYIVSGTESDLYIYLIILVVFMINYPGKQTIKQELNLDDNESGF